MNVLDALQSEFKVTLLTYTRPDFDALNEYYATEVAQQNVEVWIVDAVTSSLHQLLDPRLHTLRMSLFVRKVQQYADSFDLLISTYNELPLPSSVNSIQYIHMPQFMRFAESSSESLIVSLHDSVCSRIVGFSQEQIAENTLRTNSSWTGSVVEETYGERPDVLYPPVDTEEITQTPWEKREHGFVTVGRIAPKKNIVDLIDIVAETRANGHDVHHHIVGPIPDTAYARTVRKRAEEHQFVTLEGTLSRKRLLDLISHHRFGLHGMPREHYGMSVAELVAGGVIPFVPNGGGQREIVGGNSTLLYDEPDDAVDQIDRMLSSKQLQNRLRQELSDSSNYITPEQFREEFRSIVRETVSDADCSPEEAN